MDAKGREGVAVRAWWSKKPSPGNLGDVLNPIIIEWLSGSPPVFCPERRPGCHYAIGSILRYVRRGGIVWGSGAISANERVCRDAQYLAVRGPRTASILRDAGVEPPTVYGDPALLLPQVFNPDVAATVGIGVIPHYKDWGIARATCGSWPDTEVIKVLDSDPLAVVRRILRCRCVMSSSLHGLIVAYAYRIPAIWVEMSDRLPGDRTKFYDFYESIGVCNVNPVTIRGRRSERRSVINEMPPPPPIDLQPLIDSCPFV